MNSIKDMYKVYENFPKKGVSFIDINPILQDPEVRNKMQENISFELDSNFLSIDSPSVDKVIAVESRGFIFGAFIADYLDSGLVLARKPNKLPGKLISETYGTEYSTDTLEMQMDSIKFGDNVIIHDDVLATGGTVLAITRMVEKLGGTVVGYSFLAEIEFLKGKELLGSTIVSSIHKF